MSYPSIPEGPDSIVLYNVGGTRVRIETQRARGLFVTIVRDGAGVVQSPEGTAHHLESANLVFRGTPHIPALSAISQSASPLASLAYVQSLPSAVDRVSITFHPLGKISSDTDTPILFDVDSSGNVLSMTYTNFAEGKSTYKTQEQVRYANYRVADGVAIPFSQDIYFDGVLKSSLKISSVDCHTPILDSQFTLPQ